jgi:hypothetical protein
MVSHRFKEPLERPYANDIMGKIMKIEEYNRAVAMIGENSRGVNIATSQVILGPNNFGLNVQIGEKHTREKNTFRAFEGFNRWWNQFLEKA